MPLSLEPGSKNVVVLDADKEKDAPPAFFVRSLSMRQTRELSETYDLIWETATDTTEGDMFERLFTVLAEMVTGWSNMGNFGNYFLGHLTYSSDLLRSMPFCHSASSVNF